ncbi:hypothetical protein ACHMW4_03855 [Mesorhizobium sp. UC22_110]|uniref:hypothetical protein n=1 Tax=unclassified Mesorhizobium TaxID=325217 RepID=UPI00366FB8DC
MIRLSASVLAIFAFVTANANAAECNFDKPVGKCIGSISVDSTSGSKPSFSAEITVSSTASACSKVEWYLDGTPYQTILKSTNSDSDSVHGTKPITRKSFSSIKCMTYEGGGNLATGGNSIATCEAKLRSRIENDFPAVSKPIWAQCAKAGDSQCYIKIRAARQSALENYVAEANRCAGDDLFVANNAAAAEKYSRRR